MCKGCLVDQFSLLLVAVFTVIFFDECPFIRDWSGIGLIACGVLLLAFKR